VCSSHGKTFSPPFFSAQQRFDFSETVHEVHGRRSLPAIMSVDSVPLLPILMMMHLLLMSRNAIFSTDDYP
jgi:hypothetical protein